MMTESDAPLTLLLLGDMAIARAPHAASAQRLLAAGKPVALLAYLASAPDRTAPREEIVDLLWADLEPDAARHALRQAIWYLKRKTGVAVVVASADTVALAPDVDADVVRFVADVERREYAAAVALYRGEFLPAFAAPGATRFEHWADGERQRLRRIFAHAAEQHVRALLGAGRARDAQFLARRVRDADPLAQSGWRLLLEVLASGSDRLSASLESERLTALSIAESFVLDPATRAAMRAAEGTSTVVGAHTPAPDAQPPRTLVAELVGREREFSAIMAAAERARRGHAAWLHVHGPAGWGKSRLLGDAMARLNAMRTRVIAVRARAAERDIPWSFAADLAAALSALPGAAGVSAGAAGTLVELVPALREAYRAAPAALGDAATAAAHRIGAFAELFTAVTEDRTLVVAADDMHWMDTESRGVIAAAAARVGRARLLLVTAARLSLARLGIDADGASELALAPLDEQDVLRLLASLGDLPGEAWAQQLPAHLARAAGGSPLLALETLQLALERGLLTLTERCWNSSAPDALLEMIDDESPLARRVAQLPAEERAMLLRLAVAGAPLSAVVLGAVQDHPGLAAALLALERRGLAVRDGSDWLPAHDEVGAAITQAFTEEECADAARDVGRALALRSDDARVLPRAARLLLAGGDTRTLGDLVRRWVRMQRLVGRGEPTAAIVRQLVGEVEPERFRAIMKELPWPSRLLSSRRARVAAALPVALLLALAVPLAARRSAPAPDVTLVIEVMDEHGQKTALAGKARLADWRTDTPVPLRPYRLEETDTIGLMPDPSGARLGVASQAYRDSGAIDVVLYERDGTRRRMTEAKGDDYSPGFSPDGHAISFQSDMWRDDYLSDIAVMNLATRAVRQLTRGIGRDVSARWSPDGSRIAFIRSWMDGRPDELCWVTADGTMERCSRTFADDLHFVLGWRDAATLAVVVDNGATKGIALLSPDGRLLRTLPLAGSVPTYGTDANFVIIDAPGRDGSETWIVALDRPDTPRRLDLPVGAIVARARVTSPRSRSRAVDRLAIVAPKTIAVATRHQLTVRAATRAGAAASAPVVQWTSNAPLVATVDSVGVLTSLDTGTTVVVASTGGWRRDSVRVRVSGGTPVRPLFAERWSAASIPATWRAHGVPAPRIVARTAMRPAERALHIAGDGVYNSGVFRAAPADARLGLGVEAVVSVPVNDVRWQVLALALATPADDELALQRWLPDNDASPPLTQEVACIIAYPDGEGRAARRRLAAQNATVKMQVEADSTIPLGRPMRWRVQLLPDGRCGFAVDGRVVAMGRQKMPVKMPYHVWLFGNSVGTDVLVHSVDAWQGVKPDIDWVMSPTGPPTRGRAARPSP